MATISVTLPSDGQTADAADVNTPITTIVNAINGGLDNTNIASSAGISGSKLADGSITPSKLATSADEAVVATSQSTAVQTYGDNLATVGPSLTVTIGTNGLALVTVYSFMNNTAANSSSFVGINVSGANTITASDSRALQFQAYASNAGDRRSGTFLFKGLTAGSTTFKVQYRVDGNTGSFIDRRIAVIPL